MHLTWKGSVLNFDRYRAFLRHLAVMFITPRSCRRRHSRLHIACGEGIGQVLVENIQVGHLCGRYMRFDMPMFFISDIPLSHSSTIAGP